MAPARYGSVQRWFTRSSIALHTATTKLANTASAFLTESTMRILVYGAGNIGGLYAAQLIESGEDVSVLARGARLDDIRQHGISLENGHTGQQTTVRVKTVQQLDADDHYDLVLVILPMTKVSEVLPILAANRHTPSVMFFGNNAAGPEKMIDALGRQRVLLGFPGAAAVPHNHRLRYLILSPWEQPTTIGELDGGRSKRCKAIGEAFKAAGFPVALCSNMDAWLKTHAAKIVPTACALYMAGGNAQRLAKTRNALLLMVRAIREEYRVLHECGIPITPGNHRVFEWLPERILLALAKRMVESDMTTIKIGHADAARDEMKLLADEFVSMAGATAVPTPAMDHLYQYLTPVQKSAVAVGVDSPTRRDPKQKESLQN